MCDVVCASRVVLVELGSERFRLSAKEARTLMLWLERLGSEEARTVAAEVAWIAREGGTELLLVTAANGLLLRRALERRLQREELPREVAPLLACLRTSFSAPRASRARRRRDRA